MLETYKKYYRENTTRFLDELFDLLRIPSVGAVEIHRKDMFTTAEMIKKLLHEAGVDKAEIFPTGGMPVVYAEKIIDPAKPTVLVYGHYDVQPADPLELWDSKPFEPLIKDNKIFARGANDDKGQLFTQLKAFEILNKTDRLTCNVKFMIEGEEEVGSTSLPAFCEEHKDMLSSDTILVSDTAFLAADIPSITVGLRGLTYFEVEVTGPVRDLHSGLFGGAVGNPIVVLAEMITKMRDENNRVTIPGFYDDVIELNGDERAQLNRAPLNQEAYKKSLEVDELSGEKGYNTLERTGIRPSFDVCGIWGGYTEEGAKTVLPSKAHAKISMRLVPNQDPAKIEKMFEDYFTKLAPASVKVKVTPLHGGLGFMAPTDSKAYKAAEEAMEEVFGKKPVPFRSGGSIPVIADFDRLLGRKAILMGYGLEEDAIHSPNESFGLDRFEKGIYSNCLFFDNYAE